MGHLVCRLKLDRSLSRRKKVKTLLAGSQPYQPYKAEITNSPYFLKEVIMLEKGPSGALLSSQSTYLLRPQPSCSVS